MADPCRQEPVETAGHQRQLKVAVDLHGHRGGQGVHVEEVDAVGDVVLDEHPLGITPNEFGGRPGPLVGQQQRRLLVAQVEDRQLPQGTFVAGERDFAVQDSRGFVKSGDVFQFDASPGRRWRGGDFLKQFATPPPKGDEVDMLAIEFG